MSASQTSVWDSEQCSLLRGSTFLLIFFPDLVFGKGGWFVLSDAVLGSPRGFLTCFVIGYTVQGPRLWGGTPESGPEDSLMVSDVEAPFFHCHLCRTCHCWGGLAAGPPLCADVAVGRACESEIDAD